MGKERPHLNSKGIEEAKIQLNKALKNSYKTKFCRDKGFDIKTLNKFLNGDSIEPGVFITICDALHLNWEEVSREEPESDRPSYSIPYSGSNNFVGREDKLEQLNQALHTKGCVAISAVAGMGGVGKTEIAIQYARRHETDYPGGYCWLNIRGSTLALKLLEFAQLKGIKIPKEFAGTPLTLQQQVDWFWRNWKPPEGLTLVVLDDVTEWADCIESLPNENRFRILITTRLQNLDKNIVKEIPLHVLSPENAFKLLTNILSQTDHWIEEELQAAQDLCRRLGYLPLGLELVGYYISDDPDLTITEMLNRLEAKGLTDEALERHQATASPAQLGVKKAFDLSWEKFDATTRLVGQLLSLFNPNEILWESVESIGNSLGWEKTDINKAKNQLYKFHFVQPVEKKRGYYQIHPLIRDFLHIELEHSEQAGDIKRNFVQTFVALAKTIPDSPTQDLITTVKEAIPHLEEVAKKLINIVENKNLIWVFNGLINFYGGQGLYASAQPWCEKCLAEVRSHFGEEHPAVAASYIYLAKLSESQGRYSGAELLYKKALLLFQRLFGEEHPHIATSYTSLAALYKGQGRYSEAKPFYLKALSLFQRLLGEEHLYVATSYINLASFYDAQGHYSEAEFLYQKALSLFQRLLGEENPHIATSYSNLAGLYNAQGRYSEAETLYQKALSLRQRLLGEEHPDVAISYNNLAELYKDQERYSEAELLYGNALPLLQRLLGEEHPLVATNYNNLAQLYAFQGRYSEAELLYQKALSLRQRLLGEEHPDVATSYSNLAELYKAQRRYNEAELLNQKALRLYQKNLGKEHPFIATSYNNLAQLYALQGRYSEAESMYLKAPLLFQQLLGEEHPDVATSYSNLAELYKAQRRYNEAELLYQKVFFIRRRVLGEHPDIALTISNVAELYIFQGRYSEAESMYLKALMLFQRLLGEKHTNVAIIYNNLGELYEAQGRYSEAKYMYQKALSLL
ncbi:FxSxx-COOH system tetratricopeptide repeat protein [Tolypothrix sp. VBCCA 56010]|uniref:FxSxx-COOH system tetratricopeptide repeat protein n=1 Tax=Tolypothrix sp. VBCCA 56010 TaxID=3137731 RepID=UPI003D7DD1B2